MNAAVITISDKGARGERIDTSGPAVCALLVQHGWTVIHTALVPDEREQIEHELICCADELGVELVLTTGGTGFSPRDVTPEATLAVVERRTPGIPEAMRAESMRITPRGCLSRSEAGIRGKTLIVNLPGSEKAAKENLLAVIDALAHGVTMLHSSGSADCAAQTKAKKTVPSMDAWLKEAREDASSAKVGMYLTHCGVVRETARAVVREGREAPTVKKMLFSYDADKAAAAVDAARELPGIFYVRVWLNEGELAVGDDIMRMLIGGDIRPHVVDALQSLVARLKNECVCEQEISEG